MTVTATGIVDHCRLALPLAVLFHYIIEGCLPLTFANDVLDLFSFLLEKVHMIGTLLVDIV